MNSVVERLGWTLVHSLWQGSAVWVLLWAALRLAHRETPRVRYGIGCVALALFIQSGPIWITDGAPIQRLQLKRKPGVLVSGRVLDESGNPSRARTILRYTAPTHNDHLELAATLTDESGNFRFENVNLNADGAYEIHVASYDYKHWISTEVTNRTRQPIEITLTKPKPSPATSQLKEAAARL